MFLVKKEKNEIFSLPCKEISFKELKSVYSPLVHKILEKLAQKPYYPRDLAKELKIHEQKIYYHIHHLEKSGIIHIVKKESKQGALANYYNLIEPSFAIRFKDFQETHKIAQFKNESSFLEPFIQNGKLNALIVVGSPDPHGPEKARSRDGYYGMDLALFLGTFLNYVPDFNVKLDTEVREKDLEQNLIIIGGPVVNTITKKINDHLPIKFEQNNITSTISKETYPQDEIGLIVKTKNPFNKENMVLVVAGKRFSGTRAAIIAFLKDFKRITQGNVHNSAIKAKVVEGIDLDSDGIIDNVEFRE